MAGPAPVRKPRPYDELYAEIARLPEGMTGEILEEGILRVMSRPGTRHRRSTRGCLSALSGIDANERGAGWWIEIEAEIRFPKDRLAVPDLAGWRTERVARLPEENPLTVLPDWCCEILSPSTARVDRRLKLPLYARSGVPWIWLIDPELRFVEVFQTANGRPVLVTSAEEQERCVLPPFELEIALESWWLADAEPAAQER